LAECFADYSAVRKKQIVYSLKWGVISGVAACFISIFLGIIFSVGTFFLVLRAIVFTVIFFGLGFGLRFVINNFLPELLVSEEEPQSDSSMEQSGANVNIVMNNTGEFAVPELYKTTEELGNIEDLVSGAFKPRPAAATASMGIDRKPEAGYNGDGIGSVAEVFSGFESEVSPREKSRAVSGGVAAEKNDFSPSFGEDSGLGGLPDLDMMARAFSPGLGGATASFRSSEPEPSEPSFVSSAPPVEESGSGQAYNKGNKPQTLQGDFNPKELAEGIRAVLAKEK